MRILTVDASRTAASAAPAAAADDLRLDGRSALVTGSGRGIGAATAKLFASRGARVALFDIDEDGLLRTAREVAGGGAEVLAVRGTAAEAADCEGTVRACIERWGHLDIVVNNVGVASRVAPAWEVTDQEWSTVMSVTLNSVFYFCRAAVPYMLRSGWGRIVNIASMAGKDGNPNGSPYSTAKAGVIGLTKSLGKELATTGVLVNAIAPAVIETETVLEADQEYMDFLRSKIPMGRMGQPIEVARLVGFLVSPQTSFSTGAVYDLSGGRATY